MTLRSLVAGIAVPATLLACAAPARAVETGINETLHQTVPTVEKADRLGADWVRLWASWQHIEPAPGAYTGHLVDGLNAKVAALKARGIKVLVVVHETPGWARGGGGASSPPSDPATFGRFMGGIAARIPGVDAWELWNEPDEPQFFAGGPQPPLYAAMLKAAYPAIKAAQPSDIVVTGGMVGNNMDFLSALYDNGAQGAFDAVGVHTDTACLVDGPSSFYRDEQGRIGRYTFSSYREVHAVMTDHGDGAKPIWMTELGWNTQATGPRSCNVGASKGRKPLGVSKRKQARFLAKAYGCLAADPFIGPAFWFGMQDIPRSPYAGGYGLFQRNGKGKPSAKAFRRLDRGIRARRCGGRVDRVAPTIKLREPRDGQRFSGKLSVRVRAYDNKGGTGLQRIFLAADGEHVRSWGGSGGSIAPWWATEKWKPGPHTLTFRVRDNAHNETTLSVTVHKVRKR